MILDEAVEEVKYQKGSVCMKKLKSDHSILQQNWIICESLLAGNEDWRQ